MDFRHTDPKVVLPIGAVAEIDSDGKQIQLLESLTIWCSSPFNIWNVGYAHPSIELSDGVAFANPG